MLKIALAQMDVLAGQPTRNFERIKAWIIKAKADHADLIIFPELCLTGYILGDQWTDQAWIEFAQSFNDQIKTLSQDIGIIWGNVYVLPNHVNQDGRIAKANAAFFAYQGQWVQHGNDALAGLYIKHLQPNYRVFDERRHFLNAHDVLTKIKLPLDSFLKPFIFEKSGKQYRIGLEVCEDLWDENYDDKVNVTYVQHAVDFVVNVSSSPWTMDKEKSRQKQGLRLTNIPWIYVNRTGVENNGKNFIVYDGGSFVFSNEGKLIHTLNESAEPELKLIDFQHTSFSPQPMHKLYTMLQVVLKHMHVHMFGGKMKWVVGLSGGIDSAVSTALLVQAIGRELVLTYSLPTVYNTQQTKDNAKAIARALDIQFQEIPIQPMVDAFIQTSAKEGQSSLLLENIQARVRGSFLMNEAQRLGAVVLNNGNKIEIALGYATLYGDTIGAIAPLGDLTKLQIIELATFINRQANQTIIPLNLIPTFKDDVPIFALPPTAELKANQVDPMKWGYHDWLIHTLMSFPSLAVERVMTMFIDKRLPNPIVQLLRYYQLNQGLAFMNDLEWVLKSFSKGVFKRIQLPPNIMISRGAFGYDYRESQMTFEPTPLYLALKEKIVATMY